MGHLELLLIGIGLSMDAFAAAICQGLCMERINWRHAAVVALFFGGFQALMPLIGWGLGSRFSGQIQRLDHWVAFFLLAIIGGNMIRESCSPEKPTTCTVGTRLAYDQLVWMAVATSIDAMAVGVTFAFLETPILPAISVIGCTTFCLSLAGVLVGHVFGIRYQRRAELSGGIILVLLGTKILLEHTGVL